MDEDTIDCRVKIEPQQSTVHDDGEEVEEEEEQFPVQHRLNERFDDLRNMYHTLLSPNDHINKRKLLYTHKPPPLSLAEKDMI